MILKVKISFLLILSTIFVFGSFESEARSKRKPKWITNRPIDSDYYIGIGKSNKLKTNADYLQVAKNNALADIISEISVQISSNSILNQFETSTEYKESYEAQIKTTSKDFIEGYQLVDSWEDKEEYWVYYRLSKADYQRKKKEALDKAKNLSKDFYEKAQEAESRFDINNALIYYVKAFEALKKHLGEDLSAFTFEGKVFLDHAIYQSIQDLFSRIRIVPEKETYTLQALSSKNEPVYVRVKLKTDLETQNISNLPITFSFQGLSTYEPEQVVSLSNGKALCTIAKTAPKGRTQIIRAELNTDIYFGEDTPDNVLKILFKEKVNKPYGNLNIVVEEIFAYLESQEKYLGQINTTKPITRLLKDELSESFFSFTNDKELATVFVKIQSVVKEGMKLENHNLHTAFLDCTISISDSNSKLEIYNYTITGLKGIKSGNFELAAQDAIAKAELKIKNEIIPDIRKINLIY